MGRRLRLLVGYLSIQICALLAPCRRPILNATICQLDMRRCTSPKASRTKILNLHHVQSFRSAFKRPGTLSAF
jgi:hypothetical protein